MRSRQEAGSLKRPDPFDGRVWAGDLGHEPPDPAALASRQTAPTGSSGNAALRRSGSLRTPTSTPTSRVRSVIDPSSPRNPVASHGEDGWDGAC